MTPLTLVPDPTEQTPDQMLNPQEPLYADQEEERRMMNELVGLESVPTETGKFVVPTPPPEDAQERQTHPKIWEKGLTHLLFIGGATGVAAILLGTMYVNIFGGEKVTPAATPEATPTPAIAQDSPDTELGAWKTEAALSSQRTEFANFSGKKTSTLSTNTGTEAPAASPTSPVSAPIPTPGPTANPPVVRATVRPQSIPAPPPPRPAVFSSIPSSNSLRTYPAPQSIPAPPPLRPATSTAAFQNTANPQNSMELMAIASQAGIYTTSSSNRPRPEAREAAREAVREAVSDSPDPAPRTRALGQRRPPAQRNSPPANSATTTAVVPVTTRVKARVATPISWFGNAPDQKFRVELTEPMLASDGSVVLPQGTLFLAEITQSNRSGYINVQLLSALVNDQEIFLPPNALMVQGSGGEPLRASVKRPGSGVGSTLGLAVLSGLSSAAGTANSPTIITSGGTTTISNNNPDLGAAVAQGLSSSLVETGTSRLEQSLNSNPIQNQPTMVLKQGTKLEIFVNQPFAL